MTSKALGLLLDTQDYYRFHKHIPIRELRDVLNELHTDFNFQKVEQIGDSMYVRLPFIYKGDTFHLVYNWYYASMEIKRQIERKLNETRN